MTTFLQSLLLKLVQLPKDQFQDQVIVLPSRRACVFLKNEIIQHFKNETLLLPQIISIDEFIGQLSGLELLDSTEALLLFYKSYVRVGDEEKKSFESFMGWGQTLLQDFNEIDRYLVNTDQFFNYLHAIKDQEHWFLQDKKTDLIQNYIQFWEKLQLYYNDFCVQMNELGKGYQGYLYRKSAQNALDFCASTPYHYVFAGFNALNNAEQQIIQQFIKDQKGEVFWDADVSFLNDPFHDASLFLKRFKKQWNAPNGFEEHLLHDSYSQPKNIQITGIPGSVGQAKYVTQILDRLPAEAYPKTALVLADETFLLPILNSLPPKVTNVNITMGMSLSQTPIFAFVNQLINLRVSNKGKGFYYKEVLQFIESYYADCIFGKTATTSLKADIFKHNWVYLQQEKLNTYFKDANFVAFSEWENTDLLLTEIDSILAHLLTYFQEIDDVIQETYLVKMTEVLADFKSLISDYTHLVTPKIFKQLFGNLVNTKTVDFRGEPTQGLQIMGVLESRCLDYENVILCGVNEGNLPSGNKGNSFIPFDLKLEAKLPTYKEKDAIYAYHFYRLLQRAKNVFLTYNTEVDELNSGEKSRFIQQLELEPHPNHKVSSTIVSPSKISEYEPISEIHKTPFAITSLKNLAAYGFSPSALASYLRDPLTFYESYVLKVRDAEEVEEEVRANTLGTVIHEVLEEFYKPVVGRLLQEDDIKSMQKATQKAVEAAFIKEYSSNIKTGMNYLIVQVAVEYIQKFLNKELELIKKGNEIEIVALEAKLSAQVPTPNLDFPVVIKGTVDRIDRYNGQLRIIDYKSGMVKPADVKISGWQVLSTDYKKSKALQLLMYAYMYCQTAQVNIPVVAGNISFKNMNAQLVIPFVFGSKDQLITQDTFENLAQEIEKIVSEICNPEIPFIKNEIKVYKA